MSKLSKIFELSRNTENLSLEESKQRLKDINKLSQPIVCICSPYEPGAIFNPDPECPAHSRVKDW